ncbi:hypothetical protein IW15_18075 [Chryseobacterium soli]|uniref:Lipoprotein n=1 Tax=Chryseobacterium soli TaxID=445961 RepID=A0A086A300_9FLAO|nr:hypothetical protein [Chryseobacterium soli]KFF11064.1 hypothetical protein IW15_18075 [Chryseobacterium soli]
MKTTITQLFILLTLSAFLHSCSLGEHYHDGTYQTEMMFMRINYQIDGNEITIDNSLTGVSKLACKQYPDRIEYTEDNGTTRVLTALENGDLKFSEMVVLHKINEPINSTGEDNTENDSKEEVTEQKSATKKLLHFSNNNTSDFKKKAERLYKKHIHQLTKSGETVIDIQHAFSEDLNGDGNKEIIKFYNLAEKNGGCIYEGRGILVYENTETGIIESRYEPDYQFELKEIANGKIFVYKIDFTDDDLPCNPSIYTEGKLNFVNNKLIFEKP